jgi:hypothetical protein
MFKILGFMAGRTYQLSPSCHEAPHCEQLTLRGFDTLLRASSSKGVTIILAAVKNFSKKLATGRMLMGIMGFLYPLTVECAQD